MKHAQQTVLRNDARRKYWKKVEKDQMMAVLGSLSLLARDLPDIPVITERKRASLFISVFKGRRHVVFEAESDDVAPPSTPRDRVVSYSEAIGLIGQVMPALTAEEKVAIIKRRITPDLDARINEAYKASVEEPIERAVVKNVK